MDGMDGFNVISTCLNRLTLSQRKAAARRVIIKRILRKDGDPPDKQARATDLVLQQAEVLCKDWSDNGP